MKTTVHIADAVLIEAQRIAARDGTTLKDLIDEGLRKVVAERRAEKPFKLKDCSFGEGGMLPPFDESDWETVRDAIYKGRGT